MSMYRRVLDNFDEAIKIVDEDFEIIYANTAANAMYLFDIVGTKSYKLNVEGKLISVQIEKVSNQEENN